MKAFKRTQRLNRELLRVLAELIQTEVKDPRVKDTVVVSVNISADLSVANVYVDCINGDTQEAIEGLNAAQGFLRSRVGDMMRIKRIPRLRFFKDETADWLFKWEDMLKQDEDE